VTEKSRKTGPVRLNDMDNSELLKRVHKRMVDGLLNRGDGQADRNMAGISAMDEKLRKSIAELYLALEEAGNSPMAVDLLAEHVAILVEMINHFKSKPR